jgi:hypothetical protein
LLTFIIEPAISDQIAAAVTTYQYPAATNPHTPPNQATHTIKPSKIREEVSRLKSAFQEVDRALSALSA